MDAKIGMTGERKTADTALRPWSTFRCSMQRNKQADQQLNIQAERTSEHTQQSRRRCAFLFVDKDSETIALTKIEKRPRIGYI